MDALKQLADDFEEIRRRVARQVVGQEELIQKMLIALLAGEHCLLEATPGAARQQTVDALAHVIGLRCVRVDCHQEMTPSDLISVANDPDVDPRWRALEANFLYFDDDSKLSPAMQALLQQALKDGQVLIGDKLQPLITPHLILTGRYRADELVEPNVDPRDDRYMFNLSLRFPEYEDEFALAELQSGATSKAEPLNWTLERIQELRQVVRELPTSPPVTHYACRLTRATRVHETETPDFVYEYIRQGAGPRATHYMTLAAKINAALQGRREATTDDVADQAHAVLRHRILTNENARTNGVTVDRVISRLIYEVPARVEGDEAPP